jgi:hypothetical protein
MPSKIITLEDGFKITDIICDDCERNMQITHEDVTFMNCLCGKQQLNIAYYEFNGKGNLDYTANYWEEKARKKNNNNKEIRK